jgi:hypothetical protein
VRSACDSERPTTVTHGQSWSLDSCEHESARSAFALVRALETTPKLMVRGSVELSALPLFRESEIQRPSLWPRRAGLPSSSLLDRLGRGRGIAAFEEDGEEKGTAISAGRTADRRAISGPLTPVTSGLSRSLADTPRRRSGHVTGPDGTDSQADSAVRFP